MTVLMDDQVARQRALDSSQSFIVQAPAGSGKTGLLVQRYLSLLALVDEPEEILAITFTRKATGEMRERVIATLQLAQQTNSDELSPYEQQNWRLARAVLTRDAQRGWSLLAHPSRLRILTIDALNASLTRQLPLLSGFGSSPRISDRAAEMHQQAARRCLRGDDLDEEQYTAVQALLDHLDGDYPAAEQLLGQMLAQRQQWQNFLYLAGDDRSALEQSLQREVEQQLQALSEALVPWQENLAECARYAAKWVDAEKMPSVAAWREQAGWPEPETEALLQWRGLADLLLTAKGEWRKSWTIKIGVPAKSKDERAADIKLCLQECVAQMADENTVLPLLRYVPLLPPAQYANEQWQLLAALLDVLRLCSAHLQLVFQDQAEVDYTEIALRAVQALGDDDAPTDLALKLDYRIRHLLVDEFQDTSRAQVSLLRRLTEGWEPEDGRTLFLVGDPMQSIYRFRQAEVGLFLQAQQEGLGPVELESLHLSTNFRSHQKIVDWVNKSFSSLFPTADQHQHKSLSDTIHYTPSTLPQSPAADSHSDQSDCEESEGVWVHALVEQEQLVSQYEARSVATLAAEAIANAKSTAKPGQTLEHTVAILVRRRNDLARIIPALREQSLAFEAVDIESLAGQSVVQDLLALTRALLHRGDQLAWIAVLRAPWCGLSLVELNECVTKLSPRWPQALESLHQQFSGPAAERLQRVGTVLLKAFRQRRRLPLRQWVETTWQRLGGPACLQHPRERADADAFFQLLEGLDSAADCGDPVALEDHLQGLFARPDSSTEASALKLMTVHKAKGLEFDTVILPGLAQAGAHQQSELLQWCERPRLGQGMDLLIGPLHARGDDADPIQSYIRYLEAEQQRQEQLRLLYVATTRARRRLHLLTTLAVKEGSTPEQLPKPRKGSLMHELWPLVKSVYDNAWAAYWQSSLPPDAGPLDESSPVSTETSTLTDNHRRLPADWALPNGMEKLIWQKRTSPASEQEARPFAWAGMRARHIGTVVHAWLERMAETGLANWNDSRILDERLLMRYRLHLLGIPDDQLDAATERVIEALQQVLLDERGRWVLSAHQESACEYALNAWLDDRLQTFIIDRTFVDEQGTRWIVDYKTSSHEQGDLGDFIKHERERYQPQLQAYAQVMHRLEQRPVRTALYLPLMPLWIDVPVTIEVDGH